MNGKGSQRKGNKGEAELLKILLEHGIEAHRNQQRWTGGAGNPDIQASFRGVPLHIECKRRERLSLYAALEQAEKDASETDAFPMVIHRQNRREWIVSFRLDSFLDQFCLPF